MLGEERQADAGPDIERELAERDLLGEGGQQALRKPNRLGLVAEDGMRTANSSPPSRATMPGSVTAARRFAMASSTRSPL